MELKDAIDWAHRAEPAEVFISSHPRKTQNALWALVAEVERLTDLIYGEHGIDARLTAADAGWAEWQIKATEMEAEVTRLTHDLANERVASGYAKQMKEELESLRKEAESTLAFYAEKGRVVVARDGNAVQRLGASAEIAILKAEAEREEVERLREEVLALKEDNKWQIEKNVGMFKALEEIVNNGWPLEMRGIACKALTEAVQS